MHKNTFRAIAVDVGALNSIFFDFCHFWQKSRKIAKNREKVPSGTRQNFSKKFRISQKNVGGSVSDMIWGKSKFSKFSVFGGS